MSSIYKKNHFFFLSDYYRFLLVISFRLFHLGIIFFFNAKYIQMNNVIMFVINNIWAVKSKSNFDDKQETSMQFKYF